MRTKFTHGPNMTNSEEYDIGPYTLTETEALEIAYSILGHYRPKVIKQQQIEHERND